MPIVLYATPVITGAPQEVQFEGLTITWTGWDGSVWDLTDETGGVFATNDGSVGFGFAPADIFTSSSAALAGSRYRGSRTGERRIRLPLQVYAGSSAAWFAMEKRFWLTMRRDRPGTLTVVQKSTGEARSVAARFVTDGQPAYTHDPGARGWADYSVELLAEDPYWRGAPIRRTFAGSAPVDFLPDAPGDPFVISEGSNLSTATIRNPGDVDAWPVWTVSGPTTAVTLGVGSAEIGVPGELMGDDVLVIDTDPRRQSATLNGVRVRGVLSPHDFAPIPAGGDATLSLAVTGTGSVVCELVPRYERAW